MEGQNSLEVKDQGEAIPSKNAMDEPEEKRPRDVEVVTRMKQCREMSSGVYIKGFVEDLPVLFTADTGASRTVISTKVYNKIAGEKQPILQKSSCLIGAGGLPIQESGKGRFAIQLGTHERSMEAIVADIEDEVLLGFDVLKGGSQGAADILLSQNKIVLDGVEIPCFQVGRNDGVKRLVVADSVEIPGRVDGQNNVEDKTETTRAVGEGTSTSVEQNDGSAANPKEVGKSQRGDNWLSLHLPGNVDVMQRRDPDIAPLIEAVEAGVEPKSEDMLVKGPSARHYWILWDTLVRKNGVLYKVFDKRDGTDQYTQMILPRCLVETIMPLAHDSPVGGHLGVKKTKARIQTHYYWFKMKEDIRLYVQRCDVCASDRKPQKPPRAPLGRLAAGAPWDLLAVDYVGPFPVTPRNNRYVLVLTDHFSKYVEVMAVPNQSAEECATRILNEVVARWGTPLVFHSDQGPSFESNVFKSLCTMLQIKKSRCSARNPRGNGQAERFMKTLVQMIKAYLVGEQDQWDLYLGCIAGAYRSTPNEATKMSPILLAIGREIRMPADLIFGHVSEVNCNEGKRGVYVQGLKDKMLHAHEVARRHLGASAKRNKEMYDAKMSFTDYNVGDLVWCLHETKKVGVAPKLEKAYDGPYVVKVKLSKINFALQLDSNGSERIVHHNKLKMYEGTNPPRWVKQLARKLKSKTTNTE